MHDPGMVGIVLCRSAKQPDFSEPERMSMASILPALVTLVRRSERLGEQVRTHPIIESMLDFSPQPMLGLDLRGGLLWASDRAEALVGLIHRGRKSVPDALVKATRQLGILTGKKSEITIPVTTVAIPRKNAAPLRAELRLARTRSGTYFVIVELEDPECSPTLKETAAKYQLTAAETQILGLLSRGLSDREIGRRLFVSMATVHSHVAHILAKLEVNSRVQAALIAHGHKPEAAEDYE
jgi:DNA-binding NarL/FixJ family response regulator